MNNQAIKYMRPDGTLATNPVLAGGYNPETDKIIFHEIIGFSGDVKGGVYVDGKEKYKRLLIQRVFPVIREEAERHQITNQTPDLLENKLTPQGDETITSG